jgi:hypothetical protein
MMIAGKQTYKMVVKNRKEILPLEMGCISTAELLANLSRMKRREHRTHLGYG